MPLNKISPASEFRHALAAHLRLYFAAAAMLPICLSLSVCCNTANGQESGSPTPTLYDPKQFELRGGVMGEMLSVEKGTVGLNGELVFPQFITLPGLPDFVTPRFHMGGVGNLMGKTSYAYAGALWTVNWTPHIFSEAFVGATIHNGDLGYTTPQTRAALGCRGLWQLGANLGYRFDQHWSAMATYDHSSTNEAVTSCTPNQGINQFGLRIGYGF